MLRLNLAKALGQSPGDLWQLIRRQVHMRITFRVDFAHAAIHVIVGRMQLCMVGRKEQSHASGLNVRVRRPLKQHGQPAGFQRSAGAHSNIRAPHRRNQAWPCLNVMRILEMTGRRGDLGIRCQRPNQGRPLRFTGEHTKLGLGRDGCHYQHKCRNRVTKCHISTHGRRGHQAT